VITGDILIYGIRLLFEEYFVKTGKVPVDLGRFYSRMFDFRQKANYGDFAEFEKEKVKQWLDQASVFIGEMGAIIENKMKGLRKALEGRFRSLVLHFFQAQSMSWRSRACLFSVL
jgi:hypothetical protein